MLYISAFILSVFLTSEDLRLVFVFFFGSSARFTTRKCIQHGLTGLIFLRIVGGPADTVYQCNFRVTCVSMELALVMLNFPRTKTLFKFYSGSYKFHGSEFIFAPSKHFWSLLPASNFVLLNLTSISKWYSLGGLFELTFSLSRRN